MDNPQVVSGNRVTTSGPAAARRKPDMRRKKKKSDLDTIVRLLRGGR